MSDEWLHTRERPGGDSKTMPAMVSATPAQLLTGLPVGLPTLYAYCVGCHARLTEGHCTVVYAYRAAERATWDLGRCFCDACAPDTIEAPTLGVAEVLVRAELGTVALPRTRTHRLCLTDVAVLADSPQSEGERP
jgi:hypothetical protein